MAGLDIQNSSLIVPSLISSIVIVSALFSIVNSSNIIKHSPRRLPLFVGGLFAALVLFAIQWPIEPFLADLRQNLTVVQGKHSTYRFSSVWQSILLLAPKPWDLRHVGLINQLFAIASIVPVLAILETLFKDSRLVIVGIFGMATSTLLAFFSVSTSQHIPMLFFFTTATVNFISWQKNGRSIDLILLAITSAFIIDLRPEGALYLVPILLFPLAVQDRLRIPSLPLFLVALGVWILFSIGAVFRVIDELSTASLETWVRLNPLNHIEFVIRGSSKVLGPVPTLAGVGLLITWLLFKPKIPNGRAVIWLLFVVAIASMGNTNLSNITDHRYIITATTFRSVVVAILTYQIIASLITPKFIWFKSIIPWAGVATVLLGQLLTQNWVFGVTWPHSVDYQFLVKNLQTIPNDACIVSTIDDFGSMETAYIVGGSDLSRLLGKNHRWLPLDGIQKLDMEKDNFLYLGSACWYARRLQLEQTQGDPTYWAKGQPVCTKVKKQIEKFADLELVNSIDVKSEAFSNAKPLVPRHPMELYKINIRK